MRGRKQALGIVAAALLAGVATAGAQEPDWGSMSYTQHSAYQAVDADGFGTFPVGAGPVKMQGIILHDPADMLDTTPGAPVYMGGQWQLFVQAVEPGDSGGTCLWMGQYIGKIYGTHPEGSYSDAEWLAELDRLNHDPTTGRPFQPGDWVEVRARAPGLHYKGKTNINEQHFNVPEADFDVHLLEANHGLPAPPWLRLDDLKDEYNDFIFDDQRLVGPERYQGTLVRILDVEFVNTIGWGPGAELTITDGVGRTFRVMLGLGAGFGTHDPPTEPFDLIAIMDQEDDNGDDGLKEGYRLWVTDYDGIQFVRPVPALSPWAIGVMTLLTAVAGVMRIRRLRHATQ